MVRSLTLFALLAFASVTNASLLLNGGFEEPGTGVWNHFADGEVPGWRGLNGEDIEIGVAAVYNVTGAEGRNMLETDALRNMTVQQSVSLSAGSYELSFLYARRGVNLEGRAADTCDFEVLWNGQVVALVSPSETVMNRRFLTLEALDGVNTVAFRAAGTSDGMGAILDDATLNAVPEPCSLIAFAAMLRRRRRSR